MTILCQFVSGLNFVCWLIWLDIFDSIGLGHLAYYVKLSESVNFSHLCTINLLTPGRCSSNFTDSKIADVLLISQIPKLPCPVSHTHFNSKGTHQVLTISAMETLLNPLRAKLFRGNINIYLHFMSLLNIDMTQVHNALPQVRPTPTYFT